MLSEGERAIRPMEYPALGGVRAPVIDLETPANLAQRVRELEAQLEEKDRQFARKLERATREALDQGKVQAENEEAAWREECAGQLGAAIDEFRARRDDYLAQVEHEVVRLSLAIAERILRREAQLDPMLLSGAVRVALGQLAESTEVRLRVPAAEKEMWAEFVRLMPALPLRPEVRSEESLQVGEAILETRSGTADLSLQVQLEQIERSFFDRAEDRREPMGGVAGFEGGSGKRD